MFNYLDLIVLFVIIFSENAKDVELCRLSLNDQEIDQLRDAIEDLYYFEFVIGMIIIPYINLKY